MSSNVVVVGSINVDLVFRVPHMPSPGETVTGGTFVRGPGGKGANKAAAAAALGARTWFVGMVGPDDLGRDARRDLEAAGVDLSHLGTAAAHTGVAGIVVDERGQNLIAVASGANAEVSGTFVRDAVRAIDAETAVVVSNLEIPDDAVAAAAEIAEERGWSFLLNPAPARALAHEVLRRSDVLVPNEHEVEALGASSVDEFLAAGVGAVVVTRGEEGAFLHRPDRSVHRQRAFSVEVADTTGAGDAFCAGLAWALAEGARLEEAVRVAAAVGALACRAVGARASLPTRREVDAVAGPGA